MTETVLEKPRTSHRLLHRDDVPDADDEERFLRELRADMAKIAAQRPRTTPDLPRIARDA